MMLKTSKATASDHIQNNKEATTSYNVCMLHMHRQVQAGTSRQSTSKHKHMHTRYCAKGKKTTTYNAYPCAETASVVTVCIVFYFVNLMVSRVRKVCVSCGEVHCALRSPNVSFICPACGNNRLHVSKPETFI